MTTHLPAREAAASIGRSKRWLVAACRAGKVPVDLLTDGSRYLVAADQWERYVRSFKVVAAAGLGDAEHAQDMAAVYAAMPSGKPGARIGRDARREGGAA